MAQQLKDACDNRWARFIQLANDDEVAFLQWQQAVRKASKIKDTDVSDDNQKQKQQQAQEKLSELQDQARQIPTQVFEECYELLLILNEFIRHHSSSQLLSDAKVGFHQLAGSARASYQIILANTTSTCCKCDNQDTIACGNHHEQHRKVMKMLQHIQEMETNILKLG